MHAADHVRAREHEQIVVAAQVVRVTGESLPAEVRFREAVALDHRAHRAIEDEDAVAGGLGEWNDGVMGLSWMCSS